MSQLTADSIQDAGGGSRRTFMVGVAGLTAGAGAIATLQAATGPTLAAVEQAVDEGARGAGALVAYVKDLAGGEIAVMRGDTEVVVVDHELARALARLVG